MYYKNSLEYFNIIPVKLDGTRVPKCKWKKYQTEKCPLSVLKQNRPCGLGIVCGQTSHNLHVFDFDDITCYPVFTDFFPRFKECCVVNTPSGGKHIYLLCEKVFKGSVLAKTKNGKTKIELKGQGNLITCPFNPPSIHKSNKPYQITQGDLFNLPVLTASELETQIKRAQKWNDAVKPKFKPSKRNGNIPLTWEEILEPHDWTFVYTYNETTYWRKPLSRDSHHATTNYGNTNRFYCFSNSAQPFEPNKPYTKLEVYALLNFGGDDKTAFKNINRRNRVDNINPRL